MKKVDRDLVYRSRQSAYGRILRSPTPNKDMFFYNNPQKQDVEKLAKKLMGRKQHATPQPPS